MPTNLAGSTGEVIKKLVFPPVLPLGPGSKEYRIVADYSYQWDYQGVRYQLVVPEGFECDIASVPRLLWAFISPFDLGPAAILHDWIYRRGGHLPSGSQYLWENGQWIDIGIVPYHRISADKLFKRVMREAGVSEMKCHLAYLAVRAFGFSAWKKTTEEQ